MRCALGPIRAHPMITDGSSIALHVFRRLARTLSVLGFLSTVTVNAAQLRLQWDDNSADETGFKIERAEGTSGTFAQIATVGANVVAYTDTAVAEGKTYRYRVRAYNAAGNSPYSNLADYSVPMPNQAPTISAIASQTLAMGGATPALAVTIGDAETAATSLVLTATSTNVQLVPETSISLGGSGANRTVTVTPAAGFVGESTVTLTVSDGRASASTSFTVTVTNTAPTISAIADQTMTSGVTSLPLNFTIGDAETASTALIVTASSSNPTLISTANIVMSGTGATRAVSITPASGLTGSSVVTLSVTDGVASTSTSFTVTVVPVNTAPTITTVAAQNVSSGTPTAALAFSIADKETSATSLKVTALSSNLGLVPATGIQLAGTGATRTVSVTPVAGKTGTATITLSVSDGALGASSSFVLTVGNQAPTVLEIMDQVIAVDTSSSPIQIRINDAETAAAQLTVTARSGKTSLIPNSGLRLGGTGANRTLTIHPARSQTGTTTVTVTVSDGSLQATTTFSVLVSSGKGKPQISTHPVSQFVKSGSSVTFSVAAFGAPAPAFQWRKNGVPIAGATAPMLTINNVQSNVGAYDVVVSNSRGKAISYPAMLGVDVPTAVGNYGGALPAGSWKMVVRKDQTALYLASLPYWPATLALELELKTDGTAAVVHTAIADYIPLN
jgi:fibronectin type 3 domain-containing protein